MFRGNMKLNAKIIDRIFKPSVQINTTEYQNISSYGIDFLLLLTKYQNEFGRVDGISYQKLMDELGFCKQTFYNILYRLELLNYIKISQYSDGYWCIEICDNTFAKEDDYKNRYLNTNRDHLYSNEFKKLRANTKKLILYFMLIQQLEDGMTFKIYPETLRNVIGVSSISLIYQYMEEMNMFFVNKRHVGAKLKTILHIKTGTINIFSRSSKTEHEHFYTYKFEHFCKSYKIPYTKDDISSLVIMLHQYVSYGIENILNEIIDTSLHFRKIYPKMINKILNNKIQWIRKNPHLHYYDIFPSLNPQIETL